MQAGDSAKNAIVIFTGKTDLMNTPKGICLKYDLLDDMGIT